ncbi:FabD/lysophospholipase-like protein [Panus rudis PR-1116 ss-1]|nr:FabD/lysophospholipase-like protein [Panus rudis PR-1116 ss-1]
MPKLVEIANSVEPKVVEGLDDASYVQEVWFKSNSLDRTFCYRAIQLQLVTESHDQGFVDDATQGSWSWFEIAVMENDEATAPKSVNGKPAVWRSHCNNLVSQEPTKHFGMLYDRRHELLNSIEIGNVLAVRACCRFPGWENYADSGKLVAKLLDEDTFIPNPWCLAPPEDLGVYTVASSNECHVTAEDHQIVSKIWIATPPLDELVVTKIEQLQLFTNACNQGYYSGDKDAGDWTWFDIVVLASPEDTVPKIKNGRSLEWLSHVTRVSEGTEPSFKAGREFDRTHDLLNSLEVGDVIAVRVCAQFAGWAHYAHDALLPITESDFNVFSGPAPPPESPLAINFEEIQLEKQRLQDTLNCILAQAVPEGDPPPAYIEGDVATAASRADMKFEPYERGVRLLSLDGGGVRGISPLRILQELEDYMFKLTGNKVTKPCDYFDMMAGTSTGGLIALMLGRMKMTIGECMAAYQRMSKDIFDSWDITKKSRLTTKGARFDSSKLENAIKTIVQERLHDKNAPMLDPDNKACKVFVLAVRADDAGTLPTHLRTYISDAVDQSFADCKIWEAARATSAAPTYFPQMQIGKFRFVDGGLGFNNPVAMIYTEARTVFGWNRPVDCLLSLGTGVPPKMNLGKGGVFDMKQLVNGIISTLTCSETAHELFVHGRNLPVDSVYFRFNAGKMYRTGEGDSRDSFDWEKLLELDDWSRMNDFVKLTEQYLADQRDRLGTCASVLVQNKNRYLHHQLRAGSFLSRHHSGSLGVHYYANTYIIATCITTINSGIWFSLLQVGHVT